MDLLAETDHWRVQMVFSSSEKPTSYALCVSSIQNFDFYSCSFVILKNCSFNSLTIEIRFYFSWWISCVLLVVVDWVVRSPSQLKVQPSLQPTFLVVQLTWVFCRGAEEFEWKVSSVVVGNFLLFFENKYKTQFLTALYFGSFIIWITNIDWWRNGLWWFGHVTFILLSFAHLFFHTIKLLFIDWRS